MRVSALSLVRVTPPRLHILDLYLHVPGELPLTLTRGKARMATMGPGAMSSVLLLSRALPWAYIKIQRAQAGRESLFLPPFWPAPDKDEQAVFTDARFKEVINKAECNLCGGPDGDAVHFCTVCTNEEMERRRGKLFGGGKLAAIIIDIANALAKAVSWTGEAPAALIAAARLLSPEDPEAVFIITKLVTAVTWTKDCVPDDWTVAARLGHYFERDAFISSLADPCTVWVAHAARVLTRVCRNWGTLLDEDELGRLAEVGIRPAGRKRGY